MPGKEYSRNGPCPCGSGKKYKHCCRKKGLEYVADDDGNVSKSIPISPEMGEIFREQREKFIAKFGREPGLNDPIFFDMPPAEHIEHRTVEAMKKVGIDPAIIYAYEQTGRLVTEENQHLISDVDLDEWNAAIEEYERRQTETKPEELW